jgi:DNA (cytosine-5)-methyltransferase 1
LPGDFDLPGMSRTEKYRAVGNGVPVPMAHVIAHAVTQSRPPVGFRLCECGCGRPVGGRLVTATIACRKRLQRQRDAAGVTVPGAVTLFDVTHLESHRCD